MSDHKDWRDSNSIDSLQSLKSSFTFTRLARHQPPTNLSDTGEHAPFGSASSKLSRRESKGGLRGIFNRAKVDPESNYAFMPVIEEPTQPVPPREGYLQLSGGSLKASPSNSNYRHDEPQETVRHSTERSFTMTIRSKSLKKAKTTLKSSPKSSPRSASKPARRSSAAWDPPPLFQAYPQAIKHAQLTASTLSADAILRISSHRRNGSMRDDIAQASLGADESKTGTAKKSEKTRTKHRRQISGSMSKAEWTQKIYVLVTSGYLLQYSGEGSFDRLPEKMMQLGKDSVAFASDVIPGKHWVLQISQAMDADGTPAPDTRSLLSRLTFRGADYRRAATSLLLVLDSAEELESWITTVRREIEALGGKKCISETGRLKSDDKVMQLIAQPSHRCLFQRDPDKLSNPPTPRTLIFNPPWNRSCDGDQNPRDSMAETSSQSITEPSVERLSIGISLESQDLQQLESLRENSFRLSCMSSGQLTLVTSQGSSPAYSPKNETFGSLEEPRSSDLAEDVRPRPNAIAINERRRSMQTMQNPVLDYHAVPKQIRPRPHTAYLALGKPLPQLPSSSTPNFSVPHGTTVRHSVAKVPRNDIHHLPIQTKIPSKQDTDMKGNRKSPPTPLKARPLSPVKDQPSPIRQPLVYTPSGSFFTVVPQSKPLLIEIPARSQPSSPLVSLFHLNRRASAVPPKSPGIVYNEYQFPRRYSSMKALPHICFEGPSFPTRMTSVRPTSLRIVPLPPSPNHTSHPTQTDDTLSPRLKPKPRRLASMQLLDDSNPHASPPLKVRSSPPPKHDLSIHASKPTNPSPTPHSHPPTKPFAVKSKFAPIPVQRFKVQSNSKALAIRRSMPLLVEGPPPAPPPNCALPPLPGLGAGTAKWSLPKNGVGTRNSVRA